MHPDLESLVKFQGAETEFRRVEALLAEIPLRRKELEERQRAELATLESVRGAADATQKNRKQLETSVQDLETRRSKYKGQLMEVKTNKEYTAVVHEIEAVEKDIRSKEDQILAEMERLEGLTTEVRRAEGIHKETAAALLDERKALDAREAELLATLARARQERDAVQKGVPPTMVALYERITRLRGGAAVTLARDGMCGACHVKLRLQLWSDIRRNEAIIQCPTCQRILYFEPPLPTVDVLA
jgi:predicted  nucleic acid-binding Zn-ribbon protein